MRRMSRKSYSYHGVNEGETEEAQRLRFQVELEFVQCLASPNYLHFLAQRNYFKEQSFINYLKHLLYWKEPEYAKFLKYPMCLYFLDLLQHENFRKEIVNGQCAKFIDDQMILHWQHYTRKRMKILETGSQQQQQPLAVIGPAASVGGGTPSQNSPNIAPGSVVGPGGSTPGNNSPATTGSNPSLTPTHSTLTPAALTNPNTGGSNVTPASAAVSSASLNSVSAGPNQSLSSSSVGGGSAGAGGLLNPSLLSGPILNSGASGPSSLPSAVGNSGSPRVASPGNLSPANVLNGHSQKMQ